MPERPPVWHRDVLPEGWARAARDLADRDVLGDFYLAGGTGLALHFGHRRSLDLDLFRETEFDPASLQSRLRGLPHLRIRRAARGTLHLSLGGILVSFLHFPYPWLFPCSAFEAMSVADARDIACMKLWENAIATRGGRRDFVDLYVASRQYGLAEILAWFDEKFRATPYSRVHLYKALTYFRDAEAEPMPDMLVGLEWETVKGYFVSEVPPLSRLL